MLRITKMAENNSSVTLKPEGRIVSDWVPILEANISRYLQEKGRLLLDFSEVRFIDEQGVKMLKQVTVSGVEIINCPAFIEALVKGGGE